MDRNNKIIESERADYANLKSFISKKKTQLEASRSSLLSSTEIGKKILDRKSSNIKQLNLANEKTINKKIRKQLENDSLHSCDNLDNDYPQNEKNNKIKKRKKFLQK